MSLEPVFGLFTDTHRDVMVTMPAFVTAACKYMFYQMYLKYKIRNTYMYLIHTFQILVFEVAFYLAQFAAEK